MLQIRLEVRTETPSWLQTHYSTLQVWSKGRKTEWERNLLVLARVQGPLNPNWVEGLPSKPSQLSIIALVGCFNLSWYQIDGDISSGLWYRVVLEFPTASTMIFFSHSLEKV